MSFETTHPDARAISVGKLRCLGSAVDAGNAAAAR